MIEASPAQDPSWGVSEWRKQDRRLLEAFFCTPRPRWNRTYKRHDFVEAGEWALEVQGTLKGPLRSGEIRLVATEPGVESFAGVVVWCLPERNPSEVFISALGVSVNNKGSGVAQALLEGVVDFAAPSALEADYEVVAVTGFVHRDNGRMQRAMEKLRFGECEHPYLPDGHIAFTREYGLR